MNNNSNNEIFSIHENNLEINDLNENDLNENDLNENDLNKLIFETNIKCDEFNEDIKEINNKINEYINIEHKILVKENNENIKNNILYHLETQIDLIEKNFEKITHKQFDNNNNNNLDNNDEEELNKLLGFSLKEYNQHSIKIENCIYDLCKKINDKISNLRNIIYNINALFLKINIISNFEEYGFEEINSYFELVNKYENNVKKSIEYKSNIVIRKNIEYIHHLFNLLKILQKELYVKIITKYSCGICLENNIEAYYTNCGHVVCKSCGIKNRNINLCPFCKKDGLLKPLFFI